MMPKTIDVTISDQAVDRPQGDPVDELLKKTYRGRIYIEGR